MTTKKKPPEKAPRSMNLVKRHDKSATTDAATGKSFHAPEGYRRLTINLPEDLHLALKQEALNRDTTATAVIEGLLRQELKLPG